MYFEWLNSSDSIVSEHRAQFGRIEYAMPSKCNTPNKMGNMFRCECPQWLQKLINNMIVIDDTC